MAVTSQLPPPILKLDPTPFRSPIFPFAACRIECNDSESPHVHFPPTPSMAVTYPADSPMTYDRQPIVVSPNFVQLPRRGARKLYSPPPNDERGRTRSRRSRTGDTDIKGSYFHPRAYEACTLEPASGGVDRYEPSLPPLIQDLSPSDESDDSIATPPRATQPATQSIGEPIVIQLPDFPHKEQCSVDGKPVEPRAKGAPPHKSASLSVPPRPLLKKVARRLSGENQGLLRSVFTPNQDEGCLGGF